MPRCLGGLVGLKLWGPAGFGVWGTWFRVRAQDLLNVGDPRDKPRVIIQAFREKVR